MRLTMLLGALLTAGLLAQAASGARPADPGASVSARAGLFGWKPVGHVMALDVPRGLGVLDLNPFRGGVQTLALVLHRQSTGTLRVATLLGRVLGEGPDGGFTPRRTLAAGWRGFAWGDSAGTARVWTPAFDPARSLVSVDPALPCGTAVDSSTPLAGPFEVTIPPGARPGRKTVPSPASAFVLGDPAGGVRVQTDGGIVLGRRGAGNVAQGGFALAGAVFAYGTAAGEPALWTPVLTGRSTALVASEFLACTEPPAPPAGGTITITKELVPATDAGRFDLEIDGIARASDAGDGGTTGPVAVAAGEHTVSESPTGGTSAAYETSIECVEDTNAASPLSAAGTSLTGIPVEAEDEWACTITNTLDASALPALGVNPSSAPPGSPIALELPAGVSPGGALTLFVGGEPAPVVQSASGALAASVPLFLDPATTWPAPPSGPLDLILLSDGVPVAGADAALTVSELAPAPGSAQQAQAALGGIVDSFERLSQTLAGEPGAQEQWLTALSGALDELVNGSDPRSLAGALAAADPQDLQLVDAWFASSGVLDALRQYEQTVASAADALAAGNRSLAASVLARAPQGLSGLSTFFPSDVELAEKMQFYETAKLFGQTVIAETNQEWSTYVGIAAGAIALVRAIPAVPIISAILAVADFAFNKLYLALLPANIDSFELTLASTLLDRGETTDAVLHLAAVNEPPPIGIQDFVGVTLNVLGLGNAPEIQGLSDALLQTAAYLLGLIQQGLGTYAGEHPELNLDVGVASIPALRWETTVVDPTLVDRISQNPAVIAPLPDQVNWRASDTECGQGTILARTFANTWGDDFRDSNTVLVDVECAQVTVSPSFAELPPLGTQQFTAAVTGGTDQSVTWTASDGVITSGGVYTAPATAGTYTITATSVEEPDALGTATVEVRPQVEIDPLSAALVPGGQQQFTATVNGATDQSVTWTASGGTIDQNGLYTAGSVAGSFTVTATSVEDPTRSASASVSITPDILGIWDGTGTCETGESLVVQLRILRSDVPGAPPLYVELLAGPQFLQSIDIFGLEEAPPGTFSSTSISGPEAGSISFTVNAGARTLTGIASGVGIDLSDLRECHAAEFVVRFTQR